MNSTMLVLEKLFMIVTHPLFDVWKADLISALQDKDSMRQSDCVMKLWAHRLWRLRITMGINYKVLILLEKKILFG